MKTTFKINYTLAFLLLSVITFSCNTGKEEIAQLTEENQKVNDKYQKLLVDNRTITQQVDSLTTVVNSLKRELQKVQGNTPAYQATTADEKAIEVLVQNLHKGWVEMLEQDDTNKLLQYFLPQYTTSAVRVNTENTPTVQRRNNANFEEHLNALMTANDLSLSFGQNEFLYTEVKGDIFVTSYRTRLRVYQGNEQLYTSSLITQLAGQKKDGEWKVGNYNWVNFNY